MAQITKAPFPPCVLGVLSADGLSSRRYPASLWECDGVELRADGMPADAIAAAVADFDAERDRRGFAGPVAFTLRLRRDGGAWDDAAAAEREAVWESLPPGTCDWVDVEIEEIPRLAPSVLETLRSSGAGVLLSHHAFDHEDPPAWDVLLENMRAFRPDGVKFAVAVRDRPHAEDLMRLARRVAAEFSIGSVLGMGAAGSMTRLVGPLLGCPFAYGYLGETPAAPGQLSATAMRAFFAAAAEEGNLPDADARESEWLDWAEGLWPRVSRVRDA